MEIFVYKKYSSVNKILFCKIIDRLLNSLCISFWSRPRPKQSDQAMLPPKFSIPFLKHT